MPKYRVRDADSYGHAIGILMLDYRGPFIPGDVGNATTYDYPVLFKVVKGLTFDRVLAADKSAEADIIEAAQELERFGVRGISSDCGFLVQYQQAVAGAVKVVVRGMEDHEHFRWSILEEGGELDSDRIEAEIISEAKEMVQQHPDMGAILLECSLMPPYAASVQNATGLPVFDFITMINYFQEGTHRREYQGYY